MKSHLHITLLLFMSAATSFAEPLLSSWLTEPSGRFARIYASDADQAAINAVTAWTHPNGGAGQTIPTFAGVNEITATDTHVYVRATGLGFHTMGPWYIDDARTQIFQNFPSNIAEIFHFPRTPTIPATKTIMNGLAVGCFVDGVTMFDTRDLFSYANDRARDVPPFNRNTEPGDMIWNRNAVLAEGGTFDASNGHQADATYHMHSNPIGLRHLLNDSVDYNLNTNTYSENFNGQHSPIIAWIGDGLPLYGPYGYSDPLDSSSPVRRMVSGFQLRSDLPEGAIRSTLPLWVTRNNPDFSTVNLTAGQYGPVVGEDFPLGRYLEDNIYKGDVVGLTLGTNFDLNEYNVRWCVTPEYPAGTWAYFTCIAADGSPEFPYNLGLYYFATPSVNMAGQMGSPVTVNAVPAEAVIYFEGGPERSNDYRGTEIDVGSGDVTLTWSAIEGGTYLIESSETLDQWDSLTTTNPDQEILTVTDGGALDDADKRFYRSSLLSLPLYDSSGFALSDSNVSLAGNNILLIIVDDWGIDSSPVDNPSAARNASMPTFTDLAAQGLRFTNAYSQPTCSPTRASLMTGRYTFRHGVGSPNAPQLPNSEFTIAEAFAAADSPYQLSIMGKWHLGGGLLGAYNNGWPANATVLGELADYFNFNNSVDGSPTTISNEYATSVQVDDAVSFIQTAGANPWFCWLAFSAPHDPYHEPPSDLLPSNPTGSTNRDRYEKALEAMDTEIARLLQSVDLETTNIIIIGDNGTPRDVIQSPYTENHAKASLYDGGSHVPLIAIGPDVPASGIETSLVHCADIYSTVLALAGIHAETVTPATITLDARNLYPVLQGEEGVDGGVVIETFGTGITTPGRAIRIGDYKLIIFDNPNDALDTPSYEFYNVVNDTDEQTDLLLGTLSSSEQAAYQLLLDRNTELGGNFGQ